MSNDRIVFDNDTDPNSVVKHNNPLPAGGGALGDVDDAAATSGSDDATVIALLKGILNKLEE